MDNYVSKNAAPRKVYETKLVGSITRSHMFTGSGAFVDAEPNVFDVLIVDEVHRLNEKSGLYANLG
ncbi:ATP/GTP-binding protein [Stutzerimonas stutzeri]|nr:ATP/GTP-binding protein [Stutzerimonas stutzeri]